MKERRTRKVVPVTAHSVFEEQADGTWRAAFPPLEVEATGPTQEDAKKALFDALGARIESDEAVAQQWQRWAEENVVEQEISEEEWQQQQREKQDLIARSHAVSAGFENLDDETLRAAIASATPVLVDFWAEWCMPCHMLAPALKELADDLGDRLRVAKLNVDDHKDAWEDFGIRGIPTMILFRDGKELTRLVGAGRSKEQMRAELEPHL